MRSRRVLLCCAAAAAALLFAIPRPRPTSTAVLREPTATAHRGGEVLVLSPVRDTNPRRSARFAANLASLTYSAALLHVAVLVVEAERGLVEETLAPLRGRVASVSVYIEPASLARMNLNQKEAVRHAEENQVARRAAIARARNHLMHVALGARPTVQWCLWLDSDLLAYPPQLVQLLMAPANATDTRGLVEPEIVVPVCRCSGGGSCGSSVYDRNSWQETDASLESHARTPDERAIFEGYHESGRLHLDDLERRRDKRDGPLVPVHGVGATCILIKADLHRQGAVFPPFVLGHAIESEGLAQLLLRMGVTPYANLDVTITHA